MKPSLICAALFAAIASASSDVHDLKTDTFKDFIKTNDLVLAEFFAPWCGHCKALAPEYEEAATELKAKNIQLAKIDCTEEADLCSEYGVEGYPTLKLFRGLDSVAPYGGPRKANAIVSYMTKQALPAVSELTSKSALTEFKTADKVVLVAFLDKSDTTSNTTYTAVAESLRDHYLFGATSDAALAKAEGVTAPAIVLYKTFDEGKNTFSDKFDKDAITTFAKAAATPLIGEVGPDTYSDYMSAGLPLAYIFAETPEERETLGASLKAVAEKVKGKINIATIDAKAFGQHAGNLNLEVGKWPAFAIQDTVKNAKFPFTGEITAAAIGTFLDDFVAGKLEASVKSEPVPEKQDGPVTVIVGKNYEEIVMDDSKDVLVEFYAPWCGHCKALAPKYEELGGLYQANADFASKVTIAKVDATTNDVPDEIQGFPTIKLFRAGNKGEPITYSGSRSIEDLAEFIKENGSHKIDVYGGAPASGSAGGAIPAVSDMQHQAPAATESVKSAASVASGAASGAASAAASGASGAASAAASGASGAASAAASGASGAASVASGAAKAAASVASVVLDTVTGNDGDVPDVHDEL